MEGRSPARGGAACADIAAIGSVLSTRDLSAGDGPGGDPNSSPLARTVIASNAGPSSDNHQFQPPPQARGVSAAPSDAGSFRVADEAALPGHDPEIPVGLGRFGPVLRNQTSQPTLPSTSSMNSKRGGIRASTTQSNASLRYSQHPSGSGSFDDVADKLTLLFSDESLEHKYSLYFLQHTLSFWRKTILMSVILNALFLYVCVHQSLNDGDDFQRTVSIRGGRSGKDLLQDCPPGLWCLECPPSGRICSPYDPVVDLIVWTVCEFLPPLVSLFVTYRLRPEVLCKWIHTLSVICVVGSAGSLIYSGFSHPWTSSELLAISYMVKVYCPLTMMRIKFRWTLVFVPALCLGFGLVSLLHEEDTFNAWFSAACVLSVGVVTCFTRRRILTLRWRSQSPPSAR